MTEITRDLQAVLGRVAENAARLCGADDARVVLVDGAVFHRVAHYGPMPLIGPSGIPSPPTTSAGRESQRPILRPKVDQTVPRCPHLASFIPMGEGRNGGTRSR